MPQLDRPGGVAQAAFADMPPGSEAGLATRSLMRGLGVTRPNASGFRGSGRGHDRAGPTALMRGVRAMMRAWSG